MTSQRSLDFRERVGRRYWWHAGQDAPKYVPPVYASLSEQEWTIINDWFDETDRRALIGECQVPLMSFLQGVVMGSMVRSIVQAGHYAGYSTLMLGFMLRRMGFDHGLFTIDIDPSLCEYTRMWVERAGLGEQVHVECADSSSPGLPAAARAYLGREPQMVLIDSSHAYGHTCRELALWYPELTPGGFVICHDSAAFADSFDSTGEGGVRRAITEWRAANPGVECMSVQGSTTPHHRDGVYQDACGFFAAQKPST